MTITHEESGHRGRWHTDVDGGTDEAEMTYSKSGESTLLIDHTFVPEQARNKGVGEALAEAAVAYARDNKLKINPVCPFMAAQFEGHDWDDVRA